MKPHVILKAPRQFSITIVGDTKAARSRALIMPNQLPYLLDRLFLGETVSQAELEMFGLRIWVEMDPDCAPSGEAEPDRSGGKP